MENRRMIDFCKMFLSVHWQCNCEINMSKVKVNMRRNWRADIQSHFMR